ncbi:hypothetical protein EXIGLDRAFT_691741 [Exidia glandulosa HHB12029]|uniref:SWIM-type domain-containing protein n=1 Tax=Exidia glandulosa HHB12029 TaxID=1314781 RepID=A0A165P6J6_EXIGL|nr:hypothetical protein EXIGLDRAFT_691741 [Exidia glandulosa HHB12029]
MRHRRNEHIYPIHQHWAWAWVSIAFTAGTRTTGRVESENRVNKSLGGPTVTVKQLFNKLNLRTSAQTAKETMQLCQMENSMFYKVEVLRLPPGHQHWTDGAIGAETLPEQLPAQEDLQSMDPYASDIICLSTKYVLSVIASHKLRVTHLFTVKHTSSHATHTMAVLDPHRHVCDCMMLTNLGVPCRHFWAVWQNVQGMLFHIGLIRPRWLNNHALDVASIAPVTQTHAVQESRLNLPADTVASALSNPLAEVSGTPAPPTRSLGPQTIYDEGLAVFTPLLNTVQTQEELDDLVQQLQGIRNQQHAHADPAAPFRDPPIQKRKGRARTARLTSARESATRGRRTRPSTRSTGYLNPMTAQQPSSNAQLDDVAGGDDEEYNEEDQEGDDGDEEVDAAGPKCGICRRPGHNSCTCKASTAA